VGRNVTIVADHIGVAADVVLPLGADLGLWTDLEDWIDFFTQEATPGLDDLDERITAWAREQVHSYASATAASEADAVVIAGAVNYVDFENRAVAWVGEGSSLIAHGVGDPSDDAPRFTTVLIPADPADGDSEALEIAWKHVVSVAAATHTATINIAGNFDSLLSAGLSGDGGKFALGASFNWVNHRNTALAAVDHGASVTALLGDVGMRAHHYDQVIAISPTSGTGSGIAGNGIVALVRLDNNAHAAISDQARVESRALRVDAGESLSVWSVAGALTSADNAAVGFAVAANDLNTRTTAFVGDITVLDPLRYGEATARTASSAGGLIEVDWVQVGARTEGIAGTGALAGSVAGGSTPGDSGDRTEGLGGRTTQALDRRSEPANQGSDDLTENDEQHLDRGAETLLVHQDASEGESMQRNPDGPDTGGLNGVMESAEVDDTQSDHKPQKSKQSFGLTVSGSATINLSDSDTRAYIEQVTVSPLGADANRVDVAVVNDIDLISVSGAAALYRKGKGESGSGKSVALAGAVAYNMLENDTEAVIRNAALTKADVVNVEALTAGDQIAAALGLAVNTSAGDTKSATIAGSVSIARTRNETRALIEGSTLTGPGALDSGDMDGVSVIAYDRSRIAAGGGALALGGGIGVGAAVSVNLIGNSTEAQISDSTVEAVNHVTVEALTQNRILGLAAMVGVNKSGTAAIGGSAVFNQVKNTVGAGIRDGSMLHVQGDVTVRASGTDSDPALRSALAPTPRPYGNDVDFDGGDAFDPSYEAEADDGALADLPELPKPDGTGEAIIGVAGTLAGSAKAAIGLSFVGNWVETSHAAEIDDSTVHTAGDVTVAAADTAQVIGVAVGGGVATGKFAGIGAVVANVIGSEARAAVVGGTAIPDAASPADIMAANLDVTADKTGRIYAVAGALAFGSKAGVGAAVAYNEITTTTEAVLGQVVVELDRGTPGDGALNVAASASSAIYGGAIMGAAAGKAALGGSVVINRIGQDVSAGVSASRLTASDVNVSAGDGQGADIWALAGNIAGAGKAAIGAAVAYNEIGGWTGGRANAYTAVIDASTLDVTGSLTVSGELESDIQTLAATGQFAGAAAAGGSVTVSNINTRLSARVDDITLNTDAALGASSASVRVAATDESTIRAASGTLAGAGKAALGLASTVNRISTGVEAVIGGGTLRARDVVVDADSAAHIQTLAAGLGIGGKAGVAGSVAVNLLSTDVTALIEDGADLIARNNVDVLAQNRDAVQAIGGALSFGVFAGLAGSVAVNLIEGRTLAGIRGPATRVTALAEHTDGLIVNSARLANAPAPILFDRNGDNASIDEYSSQFTSSRLDEVADRTVHGLAVNATSTQHIGVAAGSVGVAVNPKGSVGLAATVNVNRVSGRTDAFIDEALINAENAAADARQQVDVKASSHVHTAGVVAGLGVGLVGVGGAVAVDLVDRHTEARVRDADVIVRGDLGVDARTTHGVSSIVASGSAGVGALVGSVPVSVVDTRTSAYVENTQVRADNVTVTADSQSVFGQISGALGFGGLAGAAAVTLAINESRTSAHVVDSGYDDATGRVGLDLRGDLTVQATTATVVDTIASGASLAGTGLAGMASVVVLETTTHAYLHNSEVGRAGERAGSVSVHAEDTLNSQNIAGGGALGGIVVSGAVNLLLGQSDTGAWITDSTVHARGGVDVTAERDWEIEHLTISGAVGASVAASGGVGVILLGQGGAGEDALGTELDAGGSSNLDMIDAVLSADDHLADPNVDTLSASERTSLSVSREGIGGAVRTGGGHAVTADIRASEVHAGSVTVEAMSRTASETLVGAGGFGSSIGIGGAVAVTRINNRVEAVIAGGSVVASAGDVTVSAQALDGAGPTTRVETWAGGASLVGLGLGAAWSDVLVNNQVTARSGGHYALGGGRFTVHALDGSSIHVESNGAALGAGAAAGAAVARVRKEGTVTAAIDPGAVLTPVPTPLADALDLPALAPQLNLQAITGVNLFNLWWFLLIQGKDLFSMTLGEVLEVLNIDPARVAALWTAANLDVRIAAASEGSVQARTIAASGGLGPALQGAVADVRDATVISAYVGEGARIGEVPPGEQALSRVDLSVEASGRSRVSAQAYGGALSASAAMGASVAIARADARIMAHLDRDTSVNVRNLEVSARHVLPGSGQTVSADAVTATGGILFGASAAVADARSQVEVESHVHRDAQVLASQPGIITVAAVNRTRQNADALGVAAGIAAAGAVLADAHANGSTEARFDGLLNASSSLLRVDAQGEDSVFAGALSGSGGVLAGAAALATTSVTSDVGAWLQRDGMPVAAGEAGIQAGAIEVRARHGADFDARADSRQAAVVGASGAIADNRVETTVLAGAGADAHIEARDIDIFARNTVTKAPTQTYSAQAGAGGMLIGAAVESGSRIEQRAEVRIGAGASLDVVGNPLVQPGRLFMRSLTEVFAEDAVRLDTGGALAVSLGESVINVARSDALVTIGADAFLRSVGDIIASTRTVAEVDTFAVSRTYGLAGAPRIRSEALINANQHITVNAGATLFSYGDITLLAGRLPYDIYDIQGTNSRLIAVARGDLYNGTVVPISLPGSKVEGHVHQAADIVIAADASAESVRNIQLITHPAIMNAIGRGVAKDLYRAALEGAINAVGNLLGASEVALESVFGNASRTDTRLVRVDGKAHSGVQNHQRLQLGFQHDVSEALFVYPDEPEPVWEPVDRSTLLVLDQTEGIRFTATTRDLVTDMFDRIVELQALQSAHAGNQDAVVAYQAEINRIRGQLNQLTGGSGVADFALIVPWLTIHPVVASPGDVTVTAQTLYGTGSIRAPGDASIEVINASPYFLEIEGMLIPWDSGGRFSFNGSRVGSNADINARNRHAGLLAGFSEIVTAADTDPPRIVIENSYNPDDAPWVRDPNDLMFTDYPAYLAPDVRLVGNVENLNGLVRITATQGSVIIEENVDLVGQTIDIGAGRDFVLGYTEGFRHLGGEPRAPDLWGNFANTYFQNNQTSPLVLREESEAPRPGSGQIVAGNNISISARYLNINSTITSGIPDWNIQFDHTHRDAIIGFQADYESRTNAGQSTDARYFIDSWGEGTVRVNAHWNAEYQRIELDSIAVRGGYIDLFGEVMSTSGGVLQVRDGYGDIEIANSTGFDLMIRSIDTGQSVNGTIRITDLGQRDANNRPLVTLYQRRDGDIHVYEDHPDPAEGVFVPGGEVTLALREVLAEAATTTHSPQTGLRYHWVTGTANEVRETFVWLRESSTFFDLFELDWLVPPDRDNWSERTPPVVLEEFDLREGDYVSVTPDQAEYSYYYSRFIADQYWVEPSRKSSRCVKRFLGGCTRREYREELDRITTDARFGNHSIVADHPIDIIFRGSAQGRIHVDGEDSGLIISSTLRNTSGDTHLAAGWIDMGGDGLVILTHNLTLAAQGNVGSAQAPINVSLTGVLNAASASGDVSVRGVQNDLVVDQITAGGDVILTSQESLLGVAGHLISGKGVTLNTVFGDVGSAEQAVVVATGGDMDGRLNADAGGHVFLRQATGDLFVERIHAIGDVHLHVADGSIVDANLDEERDDRTVAALEALWQDLGLLEGADSAMALDTNIAPLIAQRRRAYDDYWAWRNLRESEQPDGSVVYTADAYDPGFQFVFTSAERDLFALQRPDLDPDELRALLDAQEQLRTESYHERHAQFGEPVAYDPDWQPVVTEAERDERLAGFEWGMDQLRYAINAGLLQWTPSTEVRIQAPNIVAENVYLSAPRGSIGRVLDDDLLIDFADGFTLTPHERAVLAAAEFDDVEVGEDFIRVTLRDDLVVSASGSISASARDGIYLGSPDSLNLEDVQAPVLRIVARDAVTGATALTPVLQGGSAVIEAAQGSIGSVETPLHVGITEQLTARTGGDIHLRQNEAAGDLVIGRLFAVGEAQLQVPGGGVSARFEEGLAVNVAALNIVARDSVGGWSGAPLSVLIDAAGFVDITSLTGDVNISSPQADLNDVTVRAGGRVNVGVAGELGLRRIEAGHSDGEAVLLVALGQINGVDDEDDEAHVHADGADAQVTLSAGTGIGAAQRPLRIHSDLISAQTAAGDIFLDLLKRTEAIVLSAPGQVDVDAADDLVLGTVFGGQSVRVSAGGDIRFGSVEAGAGGLAMLAGGALDGGSLVSGGALTLQSRTMDLGDLGAVGAVSLTTAGDMRLGSVRSGRSVTARSGGSLRFGRLAAGPGGVDLAAARLLAGQRLTSGGSVAVRAGSLDLGAVEAAGPVSMDVFQGMSLDSLFSRGGVELNVGGALTLGVIDSLGAGRLQVFGNTDANRLRFVQGLDVTLGTRWWDGAQQAASLRLGNLDALWARLRASRGIDVGLASVREQLQLYADDITVRVTQAAANGAMLGMDVTGLGNPGAAAFVSLAVDARDGVDFARLYAVDAVVSTNAGTVMVRDGFIPGRLDLNTPDAWVLLNNRTPRPEAASVQLYELDHRFWLLQQGSHTYTDAYVVRYAPGWRVTVPNYLAGRELSSIDVDGVSVERDAQRFVNHTVDSDLLRRLLFGPLTWVEFARDTWLETPEGPAVNAGQDDADPAAEPGPDALQVSSPTDRGAPNT